ncbi:hypothetical protein DL735_18235 [Escherichia coli]|nr:hypothetical protein [Escherichia coli]
MANLFIGCDMNIRRTTWAVIVSVAYTWSAVGSCGTITLGEPPGTPTRVFNGKVIPNTDWKYLKGTKTAIRIGCQLCASPGEPCVIAEYKPFYARGVKIGRWWVERQSAVYEIPVGPNQVPAPLEFGGRCVGLPGTASKYGWTVWTITDVMCRGCARGAWVDGVPTDEGGRSPKKWSYEVLYPAGMHRWWYGGTRIRGGSRGSAKVWYSDTLRIGRGERERLINVDGGRAGVHVTVRGNVVGMTCRTDGTTEELVYPEGGPVSLARGSGIVCANTQTKAGELGGAITVELSVM